MCGIFGFSLKRDANIECAMAKMKIMGIYNISRGRDACGVFIDGTIIKGTGATKVFDAFIEDNDFPTPKDNLVVIGHNRWSTRGSHKEENAHPFLINERLVGVHNGTVSNADELCRKYTLDPKDYEVDSQALFTLLDNEGISILEQYKGYAAIAYTYINDPNVLYLFHGASRTYRAGAMTEERPLCYVETKDGVFFSSMADSLFAVRDSKDEVVYMLQCNSVFQVKNGEFTTNSSVVNREEVNIGYLSDSWMGKNMGVESKQRDTGTTSPSQNLLGYTTNSTPKKDYSVFREPLILKETIPLHILHSKDPKMVYYHQGRYWEFPRTICDGVMFLRRGGFTEQVVTKESGVYYFEKGIMLRDRQAYEAIATLRADKNSFINRPHEMNYAAMLSKYAIYPVTNFGVEARNLTSYHKNAWWQDSNRVKNSSFVPKFSGRNYIIEEGFLKEVRSSCTEKTLFPDFEVAAAEVDILKNGGILGGTSGEVFQEIFSPFKSDTELQLKETSDVGKGFFYENTYPTLEAAYEDLGDVELKALKDYTRKYLRAHAPLEPDDREVDTLAYDLVFTSQESGKSLLELCEDDDDRNDMINCYMQVLEDLGNVMIDDDPVHDALVESDYAIERYAPLDKYVSSVEGILEHLNTSKKKPSEMKVFEVVDDVLQDIESMLRISRDLQDEKDDDYSEEVSFLINRNIGNLLEDLKKSSRIFADEDLNKKVGRIIDKQLVA